MSNPSAFALLVGVGAYRRFDESGRTDLQGPVNDVVNWYQTARDAGVPAENIRICVSPGLPDGALGDETPKVTGATRAEIDAGLAWLVGALRARAGCKALVTWSGHGTMTADGEVLCPTDIFVGEDGTLHNGLLVSTAADVLGARPKGTRVTAFIDACHTDTGFTRGLQGRGLGWQAAGAVGAALGVTAHRGLGDLVISSSAQGEPSYELPAVGGVCGAFSWAASNLLRRWGLVDGVDGATGGLSFADLTRRTGEMLASMDVPQVPRYVGDEAGAGLRVFSGFHDAEGSVAAQALVGIEVWPTTEGGKVLEIKLFSDAAMAKQIGTVYQTGDLSHVSSKDRHGWVGKSQYWHWANGSWPVDPAVTFYSGVPVTRNLSTTIPPTYYLFGDRDLKATPGTYNPKSSRWYWQIVPGATGATEEAVFELDPEQGDYPCDCDHIKVLCLVSGRKRVLDDNQAAAFVAWPKSSQAPFPYESVRKDSITGYKGTPQ